jgi:hypothetical protein
MNFRDGQKADLWIRSERLLKVRVIPGRRFPGCERHSFCCLPCWRVHPPRRRLTTQIHGVQCMAAVGAAHPTAVSGHCNSAWPPSAAWEAHASLIDFTIQAAREGAPRQQDRPITVRTMLLAMVAFPAHPISSTIDNRRCQAQHNRHSALRPKASDDTPLRQ